jgi:hypothetical protein
LMFQFAVFQDLDQTFDDPKALGHFSLVSSPKLDVAILLELFRALAEYVPQGFTKLQLSFALRSISIGESVPAVVLDRCQDFLKLLDSVRELVDEGSFRSGSLLVCCACACHGCKKV